MNAATPQQQAPSRFTSLLSYAILLGGVATIGVTLYLVVISYSSLPYWDGWTQFDVAARGDSSFSPAWLWQLHNEHRLVIPKLFLGVDLRLFQGRQSFLLASIFVIQLLHLGLLSWSMRVLGGWGGVLWRTGTGLAAFCLFCPAQWQNFIWGFQVCFVLPQLFATLSFLSLLLYWTESNRKPDGPLSSKYLVVSVLAALGASYSLSNGNLLWPLLIVAALYLRLRRTPVLAFVVTGAVSTAFYLYHYVRPPEHADPIASLRTPLAVLKYWAAYFASSWTHHDFHASELIVLAPITIVILVLLPALSYARAFRPFAIQLVLIMLFCAATGLVTAAGRLNFSMGQALSSRYQTVALLFWCCLGLLLLGAAFARPGKSDAFVLAQLCLLLILGRGAVIARYPLRAVRQHAFEQNAIAASLLTGVQDRMTLSFAYPRTDMLLLTVPYMKANRLSVFADRVTATLGKPLESVFPDTRPDDCMGAVESVARIDDLTGPGLRIRGWAWDRKHQQIPEGIVVTTGGIINGLGAAGEWPPRSHETDRGIASDHAGFVAFTPEPPADSAVRLYTILGSHPPAACYFAAP